MVYGLDDLQKWSDRIEDVAIGLGLDFYPQEFEIVNYNDMLAYEAYSGMPSRYPHWSFGKAFERLKTLYKFNITGLPYEMVMNSNPCIAYLMRDNTLLLQILTIAHVYGHNDFFKNNRLFKEGTDAKYTVENFKSHARIIRGFINDPGIGYDSTEKILNASHTLKLQIGRTVGDKRLAYDDIKKKIIEEHKGKHSAHNILEPPVEITHPDVDKIPLEPEDDLLLFIIEYGELSEWERSIVEIVRKEALYFIPQIETKIMNEGWACYWHYSILKKLELPPNLYIEFIRRHNDVVFPIPGSINPYFIGFHMYMDLAERYGAKKIFEVRSTERDQSFIRRYLTKELCMKLNLFQYADNGKDSVVEEVSDVEGYIKIRNLLCNSAGMGMVPLIRVMDMSKSDRTLTLEHVFDGRELHGHYAEETLKHIVDLWRHKVILKTKTGKKNITITCDENKKITVSQ